MRSDSFDAIKAVVLSHGNRGNRAGGTREAPEEVVVVSPDDRATTTSPPRDDAPSREVPAGAAENAREEPRGMQPRERRDRGAAVASFCLLYTSPSPRDLSTSRMPSSA